MQLPSAVLLDFYGTLVWGEWDRLIDSMVARTGLSEDRLEEGFTETRTARGIGAFADSEEDMAAVLAAGGVRPDLRLIRDLLELERAFLATGIHLFEDSIPVLRELRTRGVRTAVVSNCPRSTRPVVERLGLEHETDAILLSFELGVEKPDPPIYLAALERLGAAPSESVFVDDQPGFCDGAARLGISTLLVRRDEASLPSTNGHSVIRDLKALLA